MRTKKIIAGVTSAAMLLTAAFFPTGTEDGADITAEAYYENYDYNGVLPTGGDKFTILCWTGDDLDPMLEMWEKDEGISKYDVNFVNFQVGGSEAANQYDQYFLGGEDVDMLMVEADWALKYINDDTATAPLEDLGFSESDLSSQYDYTREIGRATAGANKGKLVGSAFDAAPGGWCYRADLAQKYLGVNSPDEMQSMVSDWSKFKSTAQKVSQASNGRTALTTTLGGMFQAYSCVPTAPWVSGGKLNISKYHTDFINLAKDMRNHNYVTEADQWTSDWYDAGQTNDTMGYFVPTWGFGYAILNLAAGGEGGRTYGKWNVCQGPAPYYWGGDWICCSPQTDNADMAASFIKYFTIDKDTMENFSIHGQHYWGSSNLYYVNNKNAMQDIIDNGYNSDPLLDGQDPLPVLHENAQNIDLKGKITPYDAAVKTAFLDAVNAYVYGETSSASECLNDFKERVSEATDLNVGSLAGDANGDGKLNVRDSAFIASALAKGRSASIPKTADYNGDGKVNVRDAAAIAKKLSRRW